MHTYHTSGFFLAGVFLSAGKMLVYVPLYLPSLVPKRRTAVSGTGASFLHTREGSLLMFH